MSEQADVTESEIPVDEPVPDTSTAAEPAAQEPADPEGHETTTEPLPTVDPTRAAPMGMAVEPGVSRVICPSCGTVWQGNDLRPHAAWFCATCDFPLFWARAGGQSGETSTDDALARLPGTGGRSTLASLACPNCGELNPPVPTADCWRCGAPLTTPEPAPPPPIPIVVAAPIVEPPPPRRPIWPWVVATCVLSAALIVLLILLMTD
jgi:hypothetical protein